MMTAARAREGFWIESLGIYLTLEHREGKISRTHLSKEEPVCHPPQDLVDIIYGFLDENDDALINILDISSLTEFQKEVFEVVISIPSGQTMTYSQVAKLIGRPDAARAVGRALSANPFPLIIPCHRVVATKGIGGYSGGVDLKRRLLYLEKL